MDERIIDIYIWEQKGYIWDVEDALHLRRRYRIMGNAIGSVASFKSQNLVFGLPVMLSPEEVTLLVKKGVAVLRQCKGDVLLAAAKPVSTRRQRARAGSRNVEDLWQDYWEYYERGGWPNGDLGSEWAVEEEQPAEVTDPQPEPEWSAAVTSGAFFSLPIKAPSTAASAVPNASESSASVSWSYPSTPDEAARFAVFQDLHERGFFLTSGSKFGGHFLAYAGDPALFHAALVVRVVSGSEALRLVSLQAAARASFGVRKHLLLAWLSDEEDGKGGQHSPKVQYLTFEPEEAFAEDSDTKEVDE